MSSRYGLNGLGYTRNTMVVLKQKETKMRIQVNLLKIIIVRIILCKSRI